MKNILQWVLFVIFAMKNGKMVGCNLRYSSIFSEDMESASKKPK
jgi:hypothetical protein